MWHFQGREFKKSSKDIRIVSDRLRALESLIRDRAPKPGCGGRAHLIKKLICSILTRIILIRRHNLENQTEVIEALVKAYIHDCTKSSNSLEDKIIAYIMDDEKKFIETYNKSVRKIERLLKKQDNKISLIQVRQLESENGIPCVLTKDFLKLKYEFHLRNGTYFPI